MTEITLIYDADCPNADQARINLRRVLEMAGLPGRWREWVRTDMATPHDLRRFGSPTILVGGRDVAGGEPLDGTGACRIYQDENLQRRGVPGVSIIFAALHGKPEESVPPGARAGLLSRTALIPGDWVPVERPIPAADHGGAPRHRPGGTCACRASTKRVWAPGPGECRVGRRDPCQVPLSSSVDRPRACGLDSGCISMERVAQEIETSLLPSLRDNRKERSKNAFSERRNRVSKSKRKIEIFSAGCPACNDLIAQVNGAACPSCEIDILDMRRPEVAARARREGIGSVPAVAIDGQLASCCTGRGPDLPNLGQLGLGHPR